MLDKTSYLHVKLAGGATAQLLGLINAIYASRKLSLPFKISYYPYSTGTFWPFAILPFLSDIEILDINVTTKGLKDVDSLEIGRIIQNHPLMHKKASYERFLQMGRKLKLEPYLNSLRRELSVMASPHRLLNISSYYRTLSGGFAVINEKEVNAELHARFLRAGKKSPFSSTLNANKVVIHYRLGDKRAIYNGPKDFNTEPIIDPKSYVDLIRSRKDLNLENVFVVSDEPAVAKKLLSEAGLEAKIRGNNGNIWEDIYFMSKASLFIGSSSQVSRLVNIFVENNGGKTLLFNMTRNSRNSKFPNTNFLKSQYLPIGHEIYKMHFELPSNAHAGYKL